MSELSFVERGPVLFCETGDASRHQALFLGSGAPPGTKGLCRALPISPKDEQEKLVAPLWLA